MPHSAQAYRGNFRLYLQKICLPLPGITTKAQARHGKKYSNRKNMSPQSLFPSSKCLLLFIYNTFLEKGKSTHSRTKTANFCTQMNFKRSRSPLFKPCNLENYMEKNLEKMERTKSKWLIISDENATINLSRERFFLVGL